MKAVFMDITTRKNGSASVFTASSKNGHSISNQFYLAPAEELGSVLQTLVERFGRFLAVDRSQVWLFEDQDIKMARKWCAEG